MPEDKRAGLQRVRVGLTGLGAVLLIVAISAAIFETATNQSGGEARPAAAVNAAAVPSNAVEAPSDPLTEIGVTPSAPAAPVGNDVQAK